MEIKKFPLPDCELARQARGSPGGRLHVDTLLLPASPGCVSTSTLPTGAPGMPGSILQVECTGKKQMGFAKKPQYPTWATE